MPITSDLLFDFPVYANAWWNLYDKDQNLVPFRFNPAQRLMHSIGMKQRAAGKPIRVRTLKYRQAGASTYCTGFLQHAAQTHHGLTALTIADKLDLPAQWLRRGHRWLKQTPEEVRPHSGATNAIELWFDHLQSRYCIGSAEGKTPGMGATIQAIHCSEIDSWTNQDAVLSDLLPALPPGPNTCVFQESTGRNVGGWWFQRYYEAKGDPKNEYEAIFLPWFIQPEYAEKGFSGPLTDAERDLKKLGQAFAESEHGALIAFGGITEAQLAWRRRMIRTEYHSQTDLFANQYPATEQEAFLQGGRAVFSAEQGARAERTCRDPIWRGEIIIHARHDPHQFALDSSEGGRLWIYEQPRPGYHYGIGADCQWGKGRGKDSDPDFDAAFVERVEDSKICAVIMGRMDMLDWSLMLASLGYHYNTARLGPERNALAGHGVIDVLLGQAGNTWSYENLYVRSMSKPFAVLMPTDYGFLTDEHTKSQLVQRTKYALMTPFGMDWADKRAVEQMRAWCENETNHKWEAPTGQHDDLLMARMITHEVASQYRRELGSRELEPDWGSITDSQRRVLEHVEKMDKLDEEIERNQYAEIW